MNTVIKNATIIPMTSPDAIFTGDLCICGSEISYIGPNAPASCYPAEEIDGTGYAVMPSFMNAHTHSSMVLMRNYKDEEPNLQAWLQQVWKIEDKLNENDMRLSCDLAVAEMIKSGITGFMDMYFYQEQGIHSAIDAGIRADIGMTLMGSDEEVHRRLTQRLPILLKEAEASELINISIAPHAVFTSSPEAYKEAADVAVANNLKIHTHLSETKLEVTDCLRDYGVTPAFFMEKAGIFNTRATLAHCVHLTDEEVKMLKQHDVTLVHCPSSNSKLASGIARVKDYRAEGLQMAFGTDGASSNNNLNMLKEINLGCMIASVSTGDTKALRPFDALKMATTGGARALGIENLVGTLEVGKKADLIMVDLNSVPNTPTNNVYSALVYSSTSEDIKNVFCNGEMLMRDRKLLTLNERWVKERARKVWADICSR